MASIKFGSIITEAAGKVGGQILQRGRTGSQLRNLSQPVRVRSNAASSVQINFSSSSSSWRSLTNSQRSSWASLASTLTRLNKWGDPYTPTGFQIFCEFNFNLSVIDGGTKVSAAPTIVALPSLFNFNIVATTSPANYGLTWGYISGSPDWMVAAYYYGTSPFGNTYIGRTPRYMSAYAAIDVEALDFTSFVAQQYPSLKAANMTLSVGYRLINLVTGQGTPIVKLSHIYT